MPRIPFFRSEQAPETAADILIDRLIDWGVKEVFGLPGDGINGLMESLRKRQDKIRFVQVRHEQAAAFMACAYAKYTGSSACAWRRRDPAEFTCSTACTTRNSTGSPSWPSPATRFTT